MKRISLMVVLVALAGAALAAQASASSFKGSVVGRDAKRGAIAVASSSGSVHTIRVRRLRALGLRVTVHAARRPDGTFRATVVVVRGRSSRARVHGVVVRGTSAKTFVSAGGSVLAVSHSGKSLRPGRV